MEVTQSPTTEPAKKQRTRTKKPVTAPQVAAEPVAAPTPAPVNKPDAAKPAARPRCKPCDKCGQKPAKPKVNKPPTERQLASRKTFTDKVAAAKQLQTAEPGLKYKDAIKRVYAKT